MLLLLACTDPEPTTEDSVAAEEEAAILGWSDGPNLDSSRDHHVSFIEGDTLYVLAGTSRTGAANDTVERAAIDADGALSAFETLDPLPEGRIGPGIAQDGADLVVAGGLLDSSDATSATWVIHVEDDGSLTVTDGPPLVTPRYHVALVYDQGWVYATGGLYQTYSTGFSQEVLATVERASFVDGVLGAWEEIGEMPEPTTHHAAVVRDHTLYIIGGGDESKARTTIHHAPLSADGTFGAWALAGELPQGRATSAGTVIDDDLYLLTGMTSLTGSEVDTVLHATFDADGILGTFEELAPVPKQRAHSHQAPVHDGTIYSIGGSINHVPQKQVYIGRFE